MKALIIITCIVLTGCATEKNQAPWIEVKRNSLVEVKNLKIHERKKEVDFDIVKSKKNLNTKQELKIIHNEFYGRFSWGAQTYTYKRPRVKTPIFYIKEGDSDIELIIEDKEFFTVFYKENKKLYKADWSKLN